MSEQKDYDNYLKGEYYPGAPKTKWRLDFEAYMAAKAVAQQKPVIVEAPPKVRSGCRLKGRTGAEYMRDRRAKAIANGSCADCYKSPAREGKTNCAECQAKRSAREQRRWKAKKVEA